LLKIVKYNITNRELIYFNLNHLIIFSMVLLVFSFLGNTSNSSDMLISAILVLITCQLFLFFSDFYDKKEYVKSSINFISTGVALMISLFVLKTVHIFLVKNFNIKIDHLLIAMSASLLAVILSRYLLDIIIEKTNLVKKIVIVGAKEEGLKLAEKIFENRKKGFKIVGFVDDDPELLGRTVSGQKVIGIMSDLEKISKEKNVDYIIVTTNKRGKNTFCSQTLLNLKLKGYKILEYQKFYEILLGKIDTTNLRPSWFIFSDGFKISFFKQTMKRVASIILSVLGIIITAPIMLITAILIKMDSKGPVFFKQARVGKNGKIFILIKFRTMGIDAEKESGPVWAQDADPRITRIGRILRNFRIDELPQLFNVLKGEMSIVGPRPERPFFVEKLKKQINYYGQRLTVEPGITGWAAIKYGYGSSVEDTIQKLKYDLFYIKNFSVLFDFFIILLTMKVVIFGRGAK